MLSKMIYKVDDQVQLQKIDRANSIDQPYRQYNKNIHYVLHQRLVELNILLSSMLNRKEKLFCDYNFRIGQFT